MGSAGRSGRLSRAAVRVGTPGDAGMLAELGARSFVHAYAANVPVEALQTHARAAFSVERQSAELAEPGSVFLVAEHGTAAVGYAYLRTVPATGGGMLHLHRLYADPNWVRRGVGAALMEACLEQGELTRSTVIRLTVWTQNSRAIAFYRRWGFAEAGSEGFLLGGLQQEDLVMLRALGDVAAMGEPPAEP